MKAILEIDMPESCRDCHMFEYERYICWGIPDGMMGQRWADVNDDEERAPFCPLRIEEE